MRISLRGNGNEASYLGSSGKERMRLLPNISIEMFSLTISYHAICVDTHITVVLPSSTLSRGEQLKRLMMMSHRYYL